MKTEDENTMRKRPVILLTIIISAICIGSFVMYTIRDENTETLTDIIDSRKDDEIEAILDSMTLEEKVGQMFMGCFYSGTPSAETVNQYHLGSVLLFSASFESSDSASVRSQLDAIDAACDPDPIIAVDEEGGTVNRVSSFPAFRSEPFKAPRDIFTSGGLDAIAADTHEKNQLLAKLGIDLNLAPVCDISQTEGDFMYSRSLGQNANVTSDYVTCVVKTCIRDNMGCCLKHFPGYGNSADTHKGIAVDNRSQKQLEQSDLLPFKAGIQAGAPSVLVSHNIVSALDDSLPASLSPTIHRLLRYDMGFDGVIITDDLSMGAIAEFLPDVDSAVTAVMAGNDMLCTGDFKEQYQAVLEAVNSGLISEDRIDSSARKILTWKRAMSLI